jgi:L-amino acid N-acyltransferase YncA
MAAGDISIRDATIEDADACATIYAPYVVRTAVSFEADPPSAVDMAARIGQALETHAWLIAERDGGGMLGYAYAHSFAPRAAYRWACELSVYLHIDQRAAGVGTLLYTELLDRLLQRGYTTALAGMTLPNEASERLHRRMGFEPAGVYRRVGWKHETWHDVAWFQKQLSSAAEPPDALR